MKIANQSAPSGFSHTRRGTVLVWFAVFVFAMFPLLALVADLGLIILTRRQMQAAVNTAAIEGLRLRDDPSVDESQREQNRRQRAQTLVFVLYDDDLDPQDGDGMHFGAGPNFDFRGGIPLEGSDFLAGELVGPADSLAHKPSLELNLENESEGDLVSGTYYADAEHSEEWLYSRPDFEPAVNGDAFLVRLRRTQPPHNPALTEDINPGVSSSGPTVPFLFGRGPSGDNDWMNFLAAGTSVRATAIAQAQPAMTVGVSPDSSILGIAPLRISSADWAALPVSAGDQMTTISSPEFIFQKLITFGADITESSAPISDLSSQEWYVPIYLTVGPEPNPQFLVAGFGKVKILIADGIVMIARREQSIAPRNASACWLQPPSLSVGILSQLFEVRDQLRDSLLQAPSLQRAIP